MAMARDAAPRSVVLSLLLLLLAAAAAVDARVTRKIASAEAKTVTVRAEELKPTPLATTPAVDDLSRQIAHSLRLPLINRHASREIRYGNDMLIPSAKAATEEAKSMNRGGWHLDDAALEVEMGKMWAAMKKMEDENAEKKLKKTVRKRLSLMRRRREEHGGRLGRWISGLFNRF